MNRSRTAIDLIEEGVQLLRASTPVAPALYCSGTIPFLLALFNFCTEMGYDRRAAGHAPAAAWGLVFGYIWMKGFHAMACRVLVQFYTNSGQRWTSPKDLLSLWAVQIAYQPLGLFVRPIAWSLFVPGAQVSSFFLNLSVMGSFKRGEVLRAWRYARLRGMENHTVYAILCALWTIVFLDLLVTMFFLPFIAKTLLGVDSFLTRTTTWMYSPAVLIGVAALAYYVIDLLLKAIHVIRCCEAESMKTGKDLLKNLQNFSQRKKAIVLVLLLSSLPLSPFTARALAAKQPLEQLSKSDLDEKIDHVLSESRYGWRGPEKAKEKGDSPLAGITDFVSSLGKAFSETIARFLKWILPDNLPTLLPEGELPAVSPKTIQLLVYLLGGSLLMVAAVFVFRVIKLRKPPGKKKILPPAPDLESEATIADQLPPQEWVTLAEKKVVTGDLRLALRALFLANLSLLDSHRLIAVERWKSNRDYEKELRRKARTQTDLHQLFAKSRDQFERSWYGDHAVTESDLAEYSASHERIKHATIENR